MRQFNKYVANSFFFSFKGERVPNKRAKINRTLFFTLGIFNSFLVRVTRIEFNYVIIYVIEFNFRRSTFVNNIKQILARRLRAPYHRVLSKDSSYNTK